VWYDKKKVVVQTIEIVKDKEPTTHLYIAGIITEEQKE
jgi:hypothetical protein